jgi:cytochrome b6-f complex iron-sulfur subunit
MADEHTQHDLPLAPNRRGVIGAVAGGALGLAALAAAGGLWTAAIARFLMPNVVNEPPQRFKVGPPARYPPGCVETKYQRKHGVWIVHCTYRGRQQISALGTACTHLGCITIWQPAERRFKCPCHGSGFTPEGINCEGPAPRPLERYAIRIADDGQLEVDRSRSFQEQLGQWEDRESCVET